MIHVFIRVTTDLSAMDSASLENIITTSILFCFLPFSRWFRREKTDGGRDNRCPRYAEKIVLRYVGVSVLGCPEGTQCQHEKVTIFQHRRGSEGVAVWIYKRGTKEARSHHLCQITFALFFYFLVHGNHKDIIIELRGELLRCLFGLLPFCVCFFLFSFFHVAKIK